MSGHTKGPWEYMESSIVGPKLDDKETWLRPVVARFATGVSLANLNLMLAAPELLEALRWYEAQAKNMGKAAIHSDSKTILSIMHEVAVDYGKRARAAIAKATGENT